MVPLKSVFNILRSKPALKNRFLADLRHGSNSLNSDIGFQMTIVLCCEQGRRWRSNYAIILEQLWYLVAPLVFIQRKSSKKILTLSLLGYLKTRICWYLTPPSKSHVWCPNMTNDTSLESSCALLLESTKKIANLQKLNFLSQNPVI